MPSYLGRRAARAVAACALAIASHAASGQPCRVLDPGFTEFSGPECRNGLAHGHGYATGESSYLGEFFEGRRHGHGEAVFRNGVRYDGQWEHGRWNGRGKLSFPDGSYYEGGFRNGEKNGRGTYRWPSGTFYEGEWKDNARLNGVETTASGKTTTYANGAIVAAPAAPASVDRAQAARQACASQADSCETACAVGALAGALLSKGKSDGNKANAECAARCEATKQACLAGAGPSGGSVAGDGGTAVTPPRGDGARRFCAPERQDWCIIDRLVDAPPYRLLKKVCPMVVIRFDPERATYFPEPIGHQEEGLRANIRRFQEASGPQQREYWREVAEASACTLESGRVEFHREGAEYFWHFGYPWSVRRFPRSVWDTVIQHTRSEHAKGMSTRSFTVSAQYPPEYLKYEALSSECPVRGVPAYFSFYPVAWWEEALKNLEKSTQRGSQLGVRQGDLLEQLQNLKCHRQHGWPYAAENQFYLVFKNRGEGRAR